MGKKFPPFNTFGIDDHLLILLLYTLTMSRRHSKPAETHDPEIRLNFHFSRRLTVENINRPAE